MTDAIYEILCQMDGTLKLIAILLIVLILLLPWFMVLIRR